jgi:hypothetical protein
LSAKQGKVLKTAVDKKQEIMQLSEMPICDNTYVGKIYQYVGVDSGAYLNGRFYKGTYDSDSDVYSWQEVKFSADYDTTVIQGSTNAPQGGAVYTELQTKQPKTLATPIVVEGSNQTTVEGALGQLNTAKAKKFQVTTMPTPNASHLGDVVQYLGNTTGNYTKDMWYRCVFNDPTYSWEKIDYGSSITVDTALSTSSTNPVQNKVITTNLATKQNSALSTAIGGQTTVEDCLTALNNRVKATYDSNGSWVEVEVTLP